MIMSEDFLKKIRSAFDLNIYEARVWAAILSKGVATAGELADMSNVPRSRSYDVLESLEKRGFIIMKLGRPIKYIAVKPEEIVKRVKKCLKDKADEEIKSVDGIQGTDVYNELNLLFKHGIENVDPTNIAGSFKGRNNVYDHMLTLMSNATKEVLIATTAEGLVRKVEFMKSTLRKLHNSKVEIKIAAPLKTEKAKDAAKELSEYANVKDLDVNARFIIVDGKDIMFMVSHDKEVHESADVGIWANTPFFASAMKAMFEKAYNTKQWLENLIWQNKI